MFENDLCRECEDIADSILVYEETDEECRERKPFCDFCGIEKINKIFSSLKSLQEYMKDHRYAYITRRKWEDAQARITYLEWRLQESREELHKERRKNG